MTLTSLSRDEQSKVSLAMRLTWTAQWVARLQLHTELVASDVEQCISEAVVSSSDALEQLRHVLGWLGVSLQTRPNLPVVHGEGALCFLVNEPGGLWIGLEKTPSGKWLVHDFEQNQERSFAERKQASQYIDSRLGQQIQYWIPVALDPTMRATHTVHTKTISAKKLFVLAGQFLNPERSEIKSLFLYTLVTGVLSLAMPVGVQALVNTFAFGTMLQPILVLTLLISAVLVSFGILRAVQFYLIEKIQLRAFVRSAFEIAQRLLNKKPEPRRETGEKEVNLFYDITIVQKTLSGLMLEGLSSGLQLLAGFVLLALYHPLLLALAVFLVCAILFVFFVLGRGAYATSLTESTTKHRMVAFLQDLSRFSLLFRKKTARHWAENQAERLLDGHVQARRSHFRILFRQAIGSISIQIIANILLLGVGGVLVIKKQLTLGQLVAGEIIVNGLVGGLSKLYKYLEDFYDLLIAVYKVDQIRSVAQETQLGQWVDAHAFPLKELLVVVSQDHGVVRRTVHVGEKIYVRCAKAADAHAWVNRFVNPSENQQSIVVHVGGIPLHLWSPSKLRDHMLVATDTALFGGTVFQNVAVGADVALPELTEVFQRVKLDRLLAMQRGVWTDIASKEAAFSFEEELRLMMARWLLQKPRLLVIGDPFLSLAALHCQDALCALLSAPDVAIVMFGSLKNIPLGSEGLLLLRTEEWDLNGAEKSGGSHG